MASIQLTRYEAEQGDMPDVCMCCGAPATERKRRCFSSYPLWVVLTLLWVFAKGEVSGTSYSKVAEKNTRYILCYTILCVRHKNYWRIRTLAIWGSLSAILVFIFGFFIIGGLLSPQISRSMENVVFGSFCIGSVVLLLGWLISIPISQAMAIHPTISTEYQLILKRVSPAFVEAVHQYRASRKGDDHRIKPL
jgi:hypothetical protein